MGLTASKNPPTTSPHKTTLQFDLNLSESFAISLNQVAGEVFTRLNKEMAKDSNIFISPFSIVSALTMLNSGFDPKSQTYQELRKVLNQNGWKEEEVEDLMMETIPFLNSQSDVTFSVANSVWSLDLLPSFSQHLQKILFC